MTANNNIESKIDDYLLKRLTIEEMNSFEKQIQNNSELRLQVETQRKIIEGLEGYGRIKLKSELKAIHNEFFNRSKAYKWKVWMIAILMSLIMAAAYYLFLQKESLSTPQDLYLAYFEPFDYSTSSRSTENGSLFTLGVLYNQKKYSELINRFDNDFANPLEQPSDLLLAIGIAYLETDQPIKARNYFNLITQKGDFNFEEEVRWYSALSYLKEENEDSAKSLIQHFIDNESTFYHDQAKQLDQDLK